MYLVKYCEEISLKSIWSPVLLSVELTAGFVTLFLHMSSLLYRLLLPKSKFFNQSILSPQKSMTTPSLGNVHWTQNQSTPRFSSKKFYLIFSSDILAIARVNCKYIQNNVLYLALKQFLSCPHMSLYYYLISTFFKFVHITWYQSPFLFLKNIYNHTTLSVYFFSSFLSFYYYNTV